MDEGFPSREDYWRVVAYVAAEIFFKAQDQRRLWLEHMENPGDDAFSRGFVSSPDQMHHLLQRAVQAQGYVMGYPELVQQWSAHPRETPYWESWEEIWPCGFEPTGAHMAALGSFTLDVESTLEKLQES